MQSDLGSISNLVKEARRIHRDIYMLNQDQNIKEQLLDLHDKLTTILFFLELNVADLETSINKQAIVPQHK
jgi:hypothetical protein